MKCRRIDNRRFSRDHIGYKLTRSWTDPEAVS